MGKWIICVNIYMLFYTMLFSKYINIIVLTNTCEHLHSILLYGYILIDLASPYLWAVVYFSSLTIINIGVVSTHIQNSVLT